MVCASIVICFILIGDNIYISIDKYWFDVTNYKHPGGRMVLKKFHLRDATQAFNDIPGHVEAYHLLENFEIRDKELLDKLPKNPAS
jgi:cytochrome b involved in lipid metabolism